MSLRSTIVLLALLASACTSMPQSGGDAFGDITGKGNLVKAPKHRTSSLDTLGSIKVGDSTTLLDDNPLGASTVQVIEEYSAASGRVCRRINTDRPVSSERLICHERNGHWSLARGLVAASQ